jgi:hypothetical protein
MNQPSETRTVPNTARCHRCSIDCWLYTTTIGSCRPSRALASVGRPSSLVSILWTMVLPLALLCLAGCTGLASPKSGPLPSNTTAPHTATTPSPSPTPAPSPAPAAPGSATLQITTNLLPVGAVESSYSAALAASGGVPPYAWSTTSGALPTGLTLNSAGGTIVGTPTWAGPWRTFLPHDGVYLEHSDQTERGQENRGVGIGVFSKCQVYGVKNLTFNLASNKVEW